MWPFVSNASTIEAKRGERDLALAAAGIPPVDTTQYLRASVATEIVARVAAGEWTSSDVLEAYIARAVFAQSKTNCLTEVFFDRARERAKVLDEEYAKTGKLVGPLHGVPVSAKDMFDIEGIDSTIGFSQWSCNPARSNADIICQLLAAGAVPFVKTNVSQAMFSFECSNPLFGRSLSPYDPAFTCGGSSGGEGALLAMNGSALGFGSDAGGSLRAPAAYCGIYSLKPGMGRVSCNGAKGLVGGVEVSATVAGPMGSQFGKSSSLQDVAPLPFREVQLPPKLKFGYYTSDGFIKASPACKRAVLETIKALRQNGHECVEITLPDTATACKLYAGMHSSDGFKTLLGPLGRDQKDSSLFKSTLGPRLPSFVRWLATWVLDKITGDSIFTGMLHVSREKSVSEYWSLTQQRDEFIKEWQDQVWDEKLGLDGIIAPVHAVPQLPHGGCDRFSALAAGTIIYNVLNLPVGCLPVTRVDPALDSITKEWESEGNHGSKIWEKGIFYGPGKIYDPEASQGLPIGVQIVGRRWEEEKVLVIMSLVDEILGKERGFGPGARERLQDATA
ncbi:general amidase [Coprinellus micaceus]|uniref:amidase n=1 Tax=Coprinellus micaceus TaxID=71717 RepID=A0A4Y7SAS4_COPMI|nr:general amidase [Coprinellus micaceus]